MNPADLIAQLDTAPPFEPRALQLLAEFYRLERGGQLGSAILADRQAEIAAALKELETYVDEIKKVVERCSDLPAIPSQHVPTGF